MEEGIYQGRKHRAHIQGALSWRTQCEGKGLRLLVLQGCEELHQCRGYSELVEDPGSQDIQGLMFSRSVVSDSATPWTTARQASLSITNSRSLLKLMSTESVMPSNHLILCRPLLLVVVSA